ncbi:MAG: Nramp family divalent metal transporter [Pirellulales bacterium]
MPIRTTPTDASSAARTPTPAGATENGDVNRSAAAESNGQAKSGDDFPPYIGSRRMPRWNGAELIEAPKFTWKNWAALIGPGLVVGGSAIGGGEWLKGPEVTARYGGALLWLASLSILGQVIYNLEISRYALYTGEPIFTGKFRTLPGPQFWLFVYLVLDFGAVFPYLAANAATPLAAVILGEIPRPNEIIGHQYMLKGLGYAIFLGALVPLAFGGKVYNSLKVIMSFKIVFVLGFLALLAVFYSGLGTWREIGSGFFRFGTLPVERGEDLNGNGVLDPGEDWDSDGHLDVVERVPPSVDSNGDGVNDTWPDHNGDGRPDDWVDLDGDGYRDGDNVDNVFTSWWHGRERPPIDLSLIVAISAMVAIAGSGGLSNTPISNYTRDQGWGMGWHVGAIPSVIGGHHLKLSHVGSVFRVNAETLPRWRRWYRHVMRDQLAVWMPACFVGLALPSMLSVEFLRRGTEAQEWTAAGMTSDAVAERVTGISGVGLGQICWYTTLFCGFLVLSTSMASSADGLVRRWVDVFWTASGRLRKLEPHRIRIVYFAVLTAFALFGLVMLSVGKPKQLVDYAGLILNYALGFSCWHTLAVNLILLPRELRPGWFARCGLLLAGLFFNVMATVASLQAFGLLG